MNNDDVIVLGGNSPAFYSIVIWLTIFLAALAGAVLLYELAVFLYPRVIRKNRTEDLESGGGSYFFEYTYHWVNFTVGFTEMRCSVINKKYPVKLNEDCLKIFLEIPRYFEQNWFQFYII